MKKDNAKPIRVAQVIDSLDAGGGERMAVNIANHVEPHVSFSGLIATRKSGILQEQLSPAIAFICVHKKKKLDPKAIYRALGFIKKHQVTHLHAHATSFFFACVLKILKPGLILVWHDHHGNRPNENGLNNKVIKRSSFLFDHVIACSQPLFDWAKPHLHTKKLSLIGNFVVPVQGTESTMHPKDYMVCVANLRSPKDHFTLVKAFSIVKEKSDIDLLLIGEDRQDDYALQLKEMIQELALQDSIHLMGQVANVGDYLSQAKLGLLTSRIEGLPMALLEYAMAELPVVITDVGQCKNVVNNNGKVVSPGSPKTIADAIISYLKHPEKAKDDALALHKHVLTHYGPDKVVHELLAIYRKES